MTGDLIASTAADATAIDCAMAALAAAADSLGNLANEPCRFTRYRGDGWQIYLGRPQLILKACLLFTAQLRAADTGLATRISVGIGTVRYLAETGLSDANGDAFTLSGRELDAMWRSKRIVLAGAGGADKWLCAILHLVDWQVSRWSREQAEVVALALQMADPTQAELARKLGISRQAVQARLHSAGFSAMEWAQYAFESHDFQGVRQ